MFANVWEELLRPEVEQRGGCARLAQTNISAGVESACGGSAALTTARRHDLGRRTRLHPRQHPWGCVRPRSGADTQPSAVASSGAGSGRSATRRARLSARCSSACAETSAPRSSRRSRQRSSGRSDVTCGAEDLSSLDAVCAEGNLGPIDEVCARRPHPSRVRAQQRRQRHAPEFRPHEPFLDEHAHARDEDLFNLRHVLQLVL